MSDDPMVPLSKTVFTVTQATDMVWTFVAQAIGELKANGDLNPVAEARFEFVRRQIVEFNDEFKRQLGGSK